MLFVIVFSFLLFLLVIGRSTDGEDEEEVVHMGNAIMSFYSALIDLLGRCAPEMHVCSVETLMRFLKFLCRNSNTYNLLFLLFS